MDGNTFNVFRTCSHYEMYKGTQLFKNLGAKLLVIEGLSLMHRKVDANALGVINLM